MVSIKFERWLDDLHFLYFVHEVWMLFSMTADMLSAVLPPLHARCNDWRRVSCKANVSNAVIVSGAPGSIKAHTIHLYVDLCAQSRLPFPDQILQFRIHLSHALVLFALLFLDTRLVFLCVR